MNTMVVVILSFLLLHSVSVFPQFIKGVDVSSLRQIETNGGVYKIDGTASDALQIFSSKGINTVRLRLWHSPIGYFSGLHDMLLLAQRCKRRGMKLLLDFHYSDTWADPSVQQPPGVWSNLSYLVLKDSIKYYTRTVLRLMDSLQILPDYIQFGNEITSGMLWNTGRVGGEFETPTQWMQFTGLLSSAISGADEVYSGRFYQKIIHIERSGDSLASFWFYDKLIQSNVQFDIIGFSYYPWWHGSLNALASNLHAVARRYQKKIFLVETAYPWTLQWADSTQNIVGLPSQLLPGYTATVGGQKMFIQALLNILSNLPSGWENGLIYWAPEAISTVSLGSTWENLSLFDFSGNLLPSANIFETPVNIDEMCRLHENNSEGIFLFPNPAQSIVNIVLNGDGTSRSVLSVRVFSVTGEQMLTENIFYHLQINGRVKIDVSRLPEGVYIVQVLGEQVSSGLLSIMR